MSYHIGIDSSVIHAEKERDASDEQGEVDHKQHKQHHVPHSLQARVHRRFDPTGRIAVEDGVEGVVKNRSRH